MAATRSGLDHERLASRLHAAWESRVPIAPLTQSAGLASVDDAYRIQRCWAEMRAHAGETTVGRKIGLTSAGMQAQMGVDEPDYGDLWGSRRFHARDGRADVPLDPFLQPRVEGELALLLSRELRGPGVTAADVRAATEALAPAIEVVDSRIADWQIALPDTVADNASYGGFVTGGWTASLVDADLEEIRLELACNDRVVVAEPGRAVLGSPWNAVAWLANKLGDYGQTIAAGDIVLSGSFGRAVAVGPGDVFEVRVPGADGLRVRFDGAAAGPADA